MTPFAKVRLGLAAKVAICVIASTAAFFTLFGYVNLRIERGNSERLIKQSAERITDLILRSTRYQMLHNDRDALHSMVHDLGSEPGIQRIRILNPEGRVAFGTDPAELNRIVEASALTS